MELGVTVPIVELGDDLGGVREFVQAAEQLGYTHIRILDHVLGADPQYHPEVPRFPYTDQSYIHEPFTLMAFLSGITTTIKLVTGILILPQRQTALVAKQAAEVDVLSGGRLRLGIGIGWNPVEYEALGQNFHTRGRRCEEQITVLRELWTHELVNFEGRDHKISHAGIRPLPIQRPIPIWLGAGSSANPIPTERVLKRIGSMADGWFPMFPYDHPDRGVVEQVREYAHSAGRDPSDIGMEGRIRMASNGPEDWLAEAKAWEDMGATHLSASTVGPQITTIDQHIDALQRLKETIN
ncbi:MAG: LLM class F420-dependent oxidoreductase [Chloroflexota bacterium]|nr:LLM class F420-dependent oxidoreductase [Chloroflexota bacterium]